MCHGSAIRRSKHNLSHGANSGPMNSLSTASNSILLVLYHVKVSRKAPMIHFWKTLSDSIPKLDSIRSLIRYIYIDHTPLNVQSNITHYYLLYPSWYQNLFLYCNIFPPISNSNAHSSLCFSVPNCCGPKHVPCTH